ncbi:MAG: ABC transporter permease [Planctomycetota bacterium]
MARLRFGLPILVKDLTELAARRRTYIVRTVYASLLFMAFALFFMTEVSNRGLTYRLLGAGRDMLEFLIIIQLVGVYLFLPAMVAPCIAGEKERSTLGLLFTTDLGPWEILLQKYLSRLAPMFMFLLLSLPLMAVAYTFGGFASRRVLLAAYVIFTTCVQIAAWAVMWSAFCRTSLEATGAAYAGAVALAGVMGALTGMLALYVTNNESALLLPITSVFPPMLLIRVPFRTGVLVAACVLPWIWTAVFLLLARRFLVTRAFTRKKKPKDLFKQVQNLYRLLVSLRKGVGGKSHGLRGPARDLPGDRPVTWRDLSDSSLRAPGGFAFTAGVFGFVLVGAALLFSYWIGFREAQRGLGPTLVVFSLWVAGAVAVTIKSASAFAQERAKQTLELLVATPLSGREIVAQKAAAVRRRALLIFVILGALFVLEAVLETNWGGGRARRGFYGNVQGWDSYTRPAFGQFGYLLVSFLSVPIYLWMVGWLAGWIGLRSRRQSQATAVAFGAIFGICVGPFVLVPIIAALTGSHSGPEGLMVLSPAAIVVMAEIANFNDAFRSVFGMHAAGPIVANWIACIVIGFVFRTLCLVNADRYLGRPAATGADGRSRVRAAPVGEGVS